MKGEDFKFLRVGDLCVVKRGNDKGLMCVIRHIEDELLLIRPLFKAIEFHAIGVNKKIRLTSYSELDIPSTRRVNMVIKNRIDELMEKEKRTVEEIQEILVLNGFGLRHAELIKNIQNQKID